LGLNKESVLLIDFPKVNEKLRQRPLKSAYKNHFEKGFVKPISRSVLKCSKYDSLEHSDNECPKVWRTIKMDWAKVVFKTNSSGPKKI